MTRRPPRWALLAYPRSWRDHRQQEVLGLWDEMTEHGGAAPRRREAVDLVRRGLEARVELLLRPVPVRLRAQLALLALTSLASLSAGALVLGEVPPAGGTSPPAPVATLGPVMTLGALLWAGWLVVAVLATAARPGAARGWAALLALLTASTPLLSGLAAVPRPPLYVLSVAGLFGLLGCSARLPSGRAASAPLVAALTTAAPALLAVAARDRGAGDARTGFYRSYASLGLLGRIGPWCLAAVLLGAAVLAIAGRTSWFLATLVTSVPWTYLLTWCGAVGHARYAFGPVVELTLVLALVAVAAVALRWSGLRLRVERRPTG